VHKLAGGFIYRNTMYLVLAMVCKLFATFYFLRLTAISSSQKQMLDVLRSSSLREQILIQSRLELMAYRRVIN